MIVYRPTLTNQQILAYFTRPGRDINHRVIGVIRGGWTRSGVGIASAAQVVQFMAAVEGLWTLAPAFLRDAWPEPRRRLLLNWWPVGQGLFASGAVFTGTGAPLNWVYDCGTSSSDTLLGKALDAFETQQLRLGAASIRLCTISHFDKDHVTGVVRLIGRLPVQTLLLPYIPLWRRLLIALDLSVGADDEFLTFFIDPVVWLTEHADGRIDQIIFVPSSGPDDLPAAPEDVGGGPGEGGLDGRGGDLKAEVGSAPDDSEGDPALAPAPGRPTVRFLRPGGRLVAPFFWEFVPYNDATLAPKASPSFIASALPLIDQLKNQPTERANALPALKALYDTHFGKTSEARNLISLFLYSGPLGRRLRLGRGPTAGLPANTVDFAQMHTGDGLLSDVARHRAFEKFYGVDGRLARAKVFQVMHHGALGSWHKGFAAKVAPQVSIFSSDPGHRAYRHPHKDVLRDFWPYGPMQVDRKSGYSLRRRLIF